MELFWIPLGAGASVVRTSGRIFELVVALGRRRRPRALYHSALQVHLPEGRFVVEQTPVPDGHGERRGVVGSGPVGTTWAGRYRLFRYEIRRWRDGWIPDLAEAVGGPVRLAEDPARARRLLERVPAVPTPVWGRDQLGAGEMWNSNSVIAWVLAAGGFEPSTLRPPDGGRAPGWDAGVVVAGRDPFGG